MQLAGSGERSVSTGRIEALVDGVFAIVMTILVLDLKAPSVCDRLGREVFQGFISELGDPIANFGISFLLLSLFWLGHHRQFNEIRRTDPVHLTINLLFLAAISLIPFTTSLMSRFRDLWEADLFFHFNIFIVGFLMALNWWYASTGHRLVDKTIDPARVRILTRRSIVTPLMAIIGAGATCFIGGDSATVYLLMPLLTMLMVRNLSGDPIKQNDP